MSWFKFVGTAAAVLIAESNFPYDGVDKIGAMGALIVFVYFTLTRLESAIKENAMSVRENAESIRENAAAIRDLKTYLEVQEAKHHGH